MKSWGKREVKVQNLVLVSRKKETRVTSRPRFRKKMLDAIFEVEIFPFRPPLLKIWKICNSHLISAAALTPIAAIASVATILIALVAIAAALVQIAASTAHSVAEASLASSLATSASAHATALHIVLFILLFDATRTAGATAYSIRAALVVLVRTLLHSLWLWWLLLWRSIHLGFHFDFGHIFIWFFQVSMAQFLMILSLLLYCSRSISNFSQLTTSMVFDEVGEKYSSISKMREKWSKVRKAVPRKIVERFSTARCCCREKWSSNSGFKLVNQIPDFFFHVYKGTRYYTLNRDAHFHAI
jgi:hypothetical protein